MKAASAKQTEAQAEVDLAKVLTRHQRWHDVITWGGRTGVVAALWVPLQALQPMVAELAGKNTDVTLSISISIVVNVLLGGAYWAQKRKNKKQTQELQRLRARQEIIDEQSLGDVAAPKRKDG